MFKVGDTVVLKSGGPLMTVTKAGKDTSGANVVWVSWFVGDHTEKTGHFPVDALEADDGTPPSGGGFSAPA